MRCSFITAGREPCPFGCKKHWVICHTFLEGSCPCEQWEWCRNGWHTTEENLNAKYDSRDKSLGEDYSSRPTSERDTPRRSRSRNTEGKHKRAPADSLASEALSSIVRCQKWQLDSKLQIALSALGIHDSVMPTDEALDEAFMAKLKLIELQAVDGASSDADMEKVKLAYTRVRGTMTTHSQASSSSRDPTSSSK